jgi:surfactin synthase thioesterase subunit
VSFLPFSVLCIPFAGAGAGYFRQWPSYPSRWATFVPIQLPGREERFTEEPCVTMEQVVAECVSQVSPVADRGRFALFGHSFGALVAYETARYLIEETGYRPAHLIVSGVAAPSVRRAELGLSSCSDDEFVARLTRLVGYDHEAFHDPELRELILPVLRSDLAITDGYVAQQAKPLPVSISALRGDRDSLVSKDETARWAGETSREFSYLEMPGDHMYFADDWKPLASRIDQIAGSGPASQR